MGEGSQMGMEGTIRRISLRLRSLFRRRRVDQELDEEIREHLDRLTNGYIATGLDSRQAREAALREFGGVEQAKEDCRDARKVSWIQDLIQDLRFGARMLRNIPGFTAVAVLTLALGIGTNTAVFSLLNGVLLHPLPYRDPGRLTLVWEKDEQGHRDNATFATYTDWKAMSKSFEELSLYRLWMPIVSDSGDPEQLTGLRVTTNYFRMLGVRPALGRDFLPEEDAPSASHVVIISHGLWQRRFNSDPDIAGKTMSLNSVPYVVAGVLPANFESLMRMNSREPTPEIWGALGYDASLPWACRTCHHLIAIGRLRPGVTFAQATAEMDTIAAALWKAYPKDYSAAGVILTPLREELLGPVGTTLLLLFGAVTLVLLVACTNLANLLLARATQRNKEIVVRTALGAARGRIFRQLLTENCLLALLGAAAGLIPAYWTPELLASLGAGDIPRLAEVRLDWRVVLFTFGLALLTGLVSGIAPALGAWKTNLQDALKEGARGSSGEAAGRLRGVLVVSEVALSLMLMLGAGLLLRSLLHLLTVSPGFDATNVLTMRVSIVGQKYDDDKILRQFYDQALERVRALPGVEAAGAVSEIPLGGNMDMYGFHAEGKINPNPELDASAERYCVSPGYRGAMRIPLLRGRDFGETDNAAAPQVILINDESGRQMWPGEDPLGKRVKIGGIDKPWWTVVGVVGSVRQYGLDLAPTMQFYVPHAQWPFPDSDMSLAIRTSDAPTAIAGAARDAIRSLDPNQPISRVMPLGDYVGVSVQSRRLSLILLGSFAAIALLLSVVGIYGVTAYAVAQRTREIGVRMALGAQGRQVVLLLLRQELVLVMAGVALGVAASAAFTRLPASMLFEVKPTDPVTIVLVSVLLLGVALLACWIPARRATRIDPMVALRYE
ncbi:MAG: ABC transporter permease [Candidatus Acidiferrales bacterium]